MTILLILNCIVIENSDKFEEDNFILKTGVLENFVTS